MGNRLPEQQAFTYIDQQQQQKRQQTLARNNIVRPGQDQRDTRTARETYADVGDYDEQPYTRLPTSARRYDIPASPNQGRTRYEFRPKVVQTNIPPRRSAQPPTQETEDIPAARTRPKRRIHWLAIAGLGAMVALLIWVGAAWVNNKWTDTLNDWTYTQAFRTFSIDKAVGHNGDSVSHPSHFVVQNDKRHIIIIEFPADDPAKSLIYTGPYLVGDGQDRTPVTISFQLNLQTGRVDMVLHVEDQSYVFSNNGTKFVPPTTG